MSAREPSRGTPAWHSLQPPAGPNTSCSISPLLLELEALKSKEPQKVQGIFHSALLGVVGSEAAH